MKTFYGYDVLVHWDKRVGESFPLGTTEIEFYVRNYIYNVPDKARRKANGHSLTHL